MSERASPRFVKNSREVLLNTLFQPQSLSKYEEMTRRKQKKESRKSKNLLSEFNSEEIPGHQFDLDAVLQVFIHVEVLLI